jgi:hypothetical protein
LNTQRFDALSNHHRQRPYTQASVAERPTALPPVRRELPMVDPSVLTDFQVNVAESARLLRAVAFNMNSMDEVTVRTNECIADSRDLLDKVEKQLTW